MKAKHRRQFSHNNRNTRLFNRLSANKLSSLSFVLKRTAVSMCLGLSVAAWSADNIEVTQKIKQIDAYIANSVADSFNDIAAADLDLSVSYPNDAVLSQTCDNAIGMQWRNPLSPGTNTLTVSCSSPRWQGYSRIDLDVYKQVVISNEPLSRSNPISTNQLSLKRMNISQLRLGYFEDPQQLDGYQIQRTVRVGQVITPYIVKAPFLVSRGDWVTVISGRAGLTVTSTAEAMRNGVLGEQILVKNLKTDARIKAWIIEKGVVSTRQADL